MIREIYVDGYRSLIDFHIRLKSGLNVIVGPNGTGKSNFISFLDFLGELTTEGLNSAIGLTEGAGSVFSQEKFSEDAAELTFVISGSADTSDLKSHWFWNYSEDRNEGCEYSYECRLRYDKSIPAVYISYEGLALHIEGYVPWRLVRSTSLVDDNFRNSVRVEPDAHNWADAVFPWRKHQDENIPINEHLQRFVSPDASLLRSLASGHPLLGAIWVDLASYRSINVEPSLARKPSPVGTASRIQPTGEGLAAVLYRLERGTYSPSNSGIFDGAKSSEEQKQSFASIMSWCREVNDSIVKADVLLDFHEAQLKPVMHFNVDGRVIEFSLKRVSDGTVKWLALVTILFSEDRLSVIEEPENFLHPLMQEAFVALCRSVLRRSENRSVIMSTHSPTILDCCDPAELTIFEMNGGRTTASAVENATELNDTIARSRFGLGYFYRTGGVYGADRSAG